VTTINTTSWVPPGGAGYVWAEDGFLYEDVNGWHFLTHSYDTRNGWPENSNATQPSPLVSSYAFSRDLLEWHLSDEPPFPSHVTFENGTVQHFASMERPHMIFDAVGSPAYLVSAVSPVWDQYGAPCGVCDPLPGSQHSCVNCKLTKGYDSTFTIVQALGSSSGNVL
jgi:hypothetical protein